MNTTAFVPHSTAQQQHWKQQTAQQHNSIHQT
jgi:hypothetical protein